jgi:hypothetical protein
MLWPGQAVLAECARSLSRAAHRSWSPESAPRAQLPFRRQTFSAATKLKKFQVSDKLKNNQVKDKLKNAKLGNKSPHTDPCTTQNVAGAATCPTGGTGGTGGTTTGNRPPVIVVAPQPVYSPASLTVAPVAVDPPGCVYERSVRKLPGGGLQRVIVKICPDA